MTRVQKTEYISRNPLTHKYLEVCWADQTAKEIWHNTAFLENKTKINCGWCDKCLRTLLTLDIVLGSVAAYGNIFEFSAVQASEKTRTCFFKLTIIHRKGRFRLFIFIFFN